MIANVGKTKTYHLNWTDPPNFHHKAQPPAPGSHLCPNQIHPITFTSVLVVSIPGIALARLGKGRTLPGT
jgi:hypothetical protein